MSNKIKVSFNIDTAFHNDFKPINKNNARYAIKVKKDASGKERRYLYGTSSGLSLDAHGESMSERCVKGMQEQSQTKTIYLLHPHDDNILANHIGMLIGEESFVDENNEWKTVFRFWDDEDLKEGIPSANVQRAKDAFNSISGTGIYKGKPSALKQLSIQGLVDETKDIIYNQGQKTLDWVELSCVSLVEKGAYPQEDISPVQKIFKQLNTEIKKRMTSLGQMVKDENAILDFQPNVDKLEDAFQRKLRLILTDSTKQPDIKEQEVKDLFREYTIEYNALLQTINYNISEDDEMAYTRKEDDAMESKEEDFAKRKEEAEETMKDDNDKAMLMDKISGSNELSDDEKKALLSLLSGNTVEASKEGEDDETEKDVKRKEEDEVEKLAKQLLAKLSAKKEESEETEKEEEETKDEAYKKKSIKKKSKLRKEEDDVQVVKDEELAGRLADLIDDINELKERLTSGDASKSVTRKEEDEVEKDSEDDQEDMSKPADVNDTEMLIDVMEKKFGVKLSKTAKEEIRSQVYSKSVPLAVKKELETTKNELREVKKTLEALGIISHSTVQALEDVSGVSIFATDVRKSVQKDFNSDEIAQAISKNPELAKKISKSVVNSGIPSRMGTNDLYSDIQKGLSSIGGKR